MELLLVMVVIAILGTIIMGSATFITRLARSRRAQVACSVLESALYRYRSDYNTWPIGDLPVQNGRVTATGVNNAKVFGLLREDNTTPNANPRAIRYFDETTLFTVDGQGKAVALRNTTGAQPLAYAPREGGGMRYFRVVINVDNDTVVVSTPELNE